MNFLSLSISSESFDRSEGNLFIADNKQFNIFQRETLVRYWRRGKLFYFNRDYSLFSSIFHPSFLNNWILFVSDLFSQRASNKCRSAELVVLQSTRNVRCLRAFVQSAINEIRLCARTCWGLFRIICQSETIRETQNFICGNIRWDFSSWIFY